VGGKLQVVDDGDAGVLTALDAERQDTPESALEVFLRHGVAGMALEPGVGNPGDLLVILEPAGKSKRIAHMALHTEGEGLETLDQLECTERVETSSKVAEGVTTDAEGVSEGAKGLEELQTVVALRGLGELWVTCGVLPPVKLSGVDDDTADGGTVAADPL